MYARRRLVAVLIGLLTVFALSVFSAERDTPEAPPSTSIISQGSGSAMLALEELQVKGRASKSGYSRDLFGDGWQMHGSGCDTRNLILQRDLSNTIVNDACQVVSGVLNDPYTGSVIRFSRGGLSSQAVQIDHVVALSDAWQKGAQQLTYEQRVAFANDPLELLAVDGEANQQKGDGDAATWLPKYKAFRCQYVARQIAVKRKYTLWVSAAEKQAILRVLSSCPNQQLPLGSLSESE